MVLDQIRLGEPVSIYKTVHRHDVMEFCSLTGDYNPIHVDSGVVHGLLLASYVSRVIGMKMPGNGAIIATMNLEFHKPAHVGDDLEIIVTPVEKSVAAHSVVIDILIKKDGVSLVTGESVVKCP